MEQFKLRTYYACTMWQVYQIIFSNGAPYRVFLTEDGSDGWDTYAKMHEDDFFLMRPIGLKDRDGTMIYEDDIWNLFPEDEDHIPEIVPSMEELIRDPHSILINNYDCGKVIGNIHENPEIEYVRRVERYYD